MRALAIFAALLLAQIVTGQASAQDGMAARPAQGHAVEIIGKLNQEPIGSNLMWLILGYSKYYNDEELIFFFRDLWRRDIENYPSIDSSRLDSDHTRVALASLMVQAIKNGILEEENFEEFRSYLIPLVRLSRRSIREQALTVIGNIDDARDVDLVTSIVLDGSSDVFEVAVDSLARMCNRAAADAMGELTKSEMPAPRREILMEIIEGWNDFNLRTGRCRLAK